MMIKQAIQKAIDGIDLNRSEARQSMDEIMSGEATPSQVGAYLTALRMKGESVEEITASAQVMREKAARVHGTGDVMDIVGTGGDCAFTFNVSTISSIVVAAAGVKVAKHGNRAVSSKCGSADVLEALGVKIDLLPEQVEQVLEQTGICFMFAQVFHKSMKFAAGPRKELGIRTIFNILGPLSNPANANLEILGVYDEALCEPLARVLGNLGVKRALSVFGTAGLDEISLCGDTQICEYNQGKIHKYILNPTNFGLQRCELTDMLGGDASENAAIARNILQGEKGPKRDMVLINAAAALYIADVSDSLKDCVSAAAEVIDSGKAHHKLDEFIAATNCF